MTNFSLQSISHNLRLLYLCTWPFCSPPISSGVSSLCGLHWSRCCFSSFYQSLQLSSGILQSSLASIVSCLWGPVVSDVSTTLNRTLTSPCSGIYSFNQSPLVSAVCSGVCSLCKSSWPLWYPVLSNVGHHRVVTAFFKSSVLYVVFIVSKVSTVSMHQSAV